MSPKCQKTKHNPFLSLIELHIFLITALHSEVFQKLISYRSFLLFMDSPDHLKGELTLINLLRDYRALEFICLETIALLNLQDRTSSEFGRHKKTIFTELGTFL